MKLHLDGKFIGKATVAAVVYLLCFGIVMAVLPVRPFWNDEWRLIYNIKFKTPAQLWGRLDLLQECPRVYLILIKKITAAFDYSYTALRLPPLIISCFSFLLLFYLVKRIFDKGSIYGYLWMLIIISSQTFTDYMVQVKQYEMDIFLCLLVFWQYLELLDIARDGVGSRLRFLLLCATVLVVPYFSYMYPISFAPLVPLVTLKAIMSKRAEKSGAGIVYVLLPILIATATIAVFYYIDVKQVMADDRMYLSYLKMLGQKKGEIHFIENCWNLFALVGSGALFEIVFGVVGILAFVYNTYALARKRWSEFTTMDYLKAYAVLLLFVTLVLFLSGRLLGNVARLVVFTVPSISLLIAALVKDMSNTARFVRVSRVVKVVLFLGLFGNILSTCINNFTYSDYNHCISTYRSITKALQQARQSHIPIMITDGALAEKVPEPGPVPGSIASNTINQEQIDGAEYVCPEVVLKVDPEYKLWDTVAIYYMPDAKWIKEYFLQLPPQYNAAIACDGINIFPMHR